METFLKLREIIWEVTSACKNNCNYCGSKGGWSKTTNEDTIKKITDQISMYPPEQIDISGGDALLVSHQTHKYIVDTLSAKNVVCKILVNPKSFVTNNPAEVKKILDLYSVVGVSVNTEEEIKIAKNTSGIGLNGKMTVISNFNLQNFFMFNDIKEFVKQSKATWQVQFTVYKQESELAMYENDQALKMLSKLISDAINVESVPIVIADNANDGICSAGRFSIGLTSDGNVIPCLSMRSWTNDLEVQGNILITPLEDLWIEKFKKYRFTPFYCCKDHCKNKIIKLEQSSSLDSLKLQDSYGIWFPPQIQKIGVQAYAVTPPYGVLVYAVMPPSVMPPSCIYSVVGSGSISVSSSSDKANSADSWISNPAYTDGSLHRDLSDCTFVKGDTSED